MRYLSPKVMSKIDTVVARDKVVADLVAEYRADVGLTADSAKAAVLVDPEVQRFLDEAKSEEPRLDRFCNNCHQTAKQAGIATLLRCSGCMLVYYCSRSCQKASWKGHKSFCKPVQC